MPLPMKDFLPDDDYVEAKDGKKYFITADVPKKTAKELNEIVKNIDKGDAVENCYSVVKKLLGMHEKNDQKEVDVFVDSSGLAAINKMMLFCMEFINQSHLKDTPKKKDSKD